MSKFTESFNKRKKHYHSEMFHSQCSKS